MSVTVKFGAKSLVCPAGACHGIKVALSGLLDGQLAPSEMKLLAKGKVVSADDAAIAPNTKLMLIHVPTAAPLVRLRVREIVSGRVPRAPVLVSPSTSHDELISTVIRALRLPPCDEFTEVRLFLPHLGSLMRTDLSLADYPLPNGGAEALEVYAVPCPIAQTPEELAARAQEQAEELMRAQAAHCTKAGLAGGDDALQDPSPAGEPSEQVDPRQALAGLLAEREHLLGELASHAASPSVGAAEAEAVRRMLDDMEAAAAASADSGGPTAFREAQAERAAEVAAAHTRARQAAHLESLGVPSNLRTGLMPAPEDAAPAPEDAARVVHVELPAQLLEDLDCDLELSCVPPSLGEWELFCAHEEERLEERCADLIASLAPLRPLPPSSSSPQTGSAHRGRPHERPGREVRNRSSSPQAGERRRVRRNRLEAAFALAAAEGYADSLGELSSSAGSVASADSSHGASHMALSDADGWELAHSRGSEGGEDEDGIDGRWSGCEACSDAPSDSSPSTLATLERVRSTSAVCVEGVGGVGVSAPSPNPVAKKKVKGLACKQCSCRLPLTACASACKCGDVFCAECMPASRHACPVDYKAMHIKKLQEDNPKLGSQRLERM